MFYDERAIGSNVLGDRQFFLDLFIEDESIHEVFGGEKRIVKKEGSATHSGGNNRGPLGISCSISQIQIPLNYELWLEMRDSDRVRLEHKYFGGKTYQEMLVKILKK